MYRLNTGQGPERSNLLVERFPMAGKLRQGREIDLRRLFQPRLICFPVGVNTPTVRKPAVLAVFRA